MSVSRPVVVMQLPEEFNAETSQAFCKEIEPLLEAHRPRIVLDCSLVRSIDGAGVEMLLHCLEEAMKRDGDLKLCCLSAQSEVVLELLRVDRVFEIFASAEEGVRSFNALPVDVIPQDAPWYSAVFGELGVLKQAS
ncbi:MAG TPA: STAS domain-containing protein [Candidatus Solibacter sp.]|nr:STAS domain-containing protein [Candidatus Solibacter sp.]